LISSTYLDVRKYRIFAIYGIPKIQGHVKVSPTERGRLLSLTAAMNRTFALGRILAGGSAAVLQAARNANNEQDLINNLYFHKHRRIDPNKSPLFINIAG
jgi:hypothetical protein